MDKKIKKMEKLQEWAPEALATFKAWFSAIEIKMPMIDDELWQSAYVICHGANEIAKHFDDTDVVVSLLCDDDDFWPHFHASDRRVLGELTKMARAFSENPEVAGRDILDNMLHPAPGSLPPDHKARFSKLDEIIHGSTVPAPGTADSTKYLLELLKDIRHGKVSEADLAAFERAYGHQTDRVLSNLKTPDPAPRGSIDIGEVSLDDVLQQANKTPCRPPRDHARKSMSAVNDMLKRRAGLLPV